MACMIHSCSQRSQLRAYFHVDCKNYQRSQEHEDQRELPGEEEGNYKTTIPEIRATEDSNSPQIVPINEFSKAVSVERDATTEGGVWSGSSNHLMLFVSKDSKPILLTVQVNVSLTSPTDNVFRSYKTVTAITTMRLQRAELLTCSSALSASVQFPILRYAYKLFRPEIESAKVTPIITLQHPIRREDISPTFKHSLFLQAIAHSYFRAFFVCIAIIRLSSQDSLLSDSITSSISLLSSSGTTFATISLSSVENFYYTASNSQTSSAFTSASSLDLSYPYTSPAYTPFISTSSL